METNDTPQKPWWHITPRFARGRAYFLVAALLLVQAAGGFLGDSFWFFELFCHFQSQYLVVAVLALTALGYACLRERRCTRGDLAAWLGGFLLASYSATWILGLMPALAPLEPKPLATTDPDLGRLKVVSANLFTSNRQHQLVADLVQAESPDLVLLMELNNRWVEALAALSAEYPHQLIRPDDSGNFGIGLWSRWPLEQQAVEDFGSFTRQLHVVLRPGSLGGRRLRFVGMHPLPPLPGDRHAYRNRAFDGVADLLEREERLPTVVVGDLNNTRYAASMRAFCRRAGLFDAGHATWGRSWPVGILHSVIALRIDFILIDRSWRVRDFRIGPNVGSDHYPLVAELQLVE